MKMKLNQQKKIQQIQINHKLMKKNKKNKKMKKKKKKKNKIIK